MRGIFGKNIDPREAQRLSAQKRRENTERREAMMAILKGEGWTDAEMAAAGARMLVATKAELIELAKNEQVPNDLRRRAVAMIDKDNDRAISMGQTIRAEVYGKPRQKVDIGIDEAPPATVINVIDASKEE